MRIPLTINTDYLPDWGTAEGLRELAQNWLDAGGTAADLKYQGGTFTLANPGAHINREALLLGTTTKYGDAAKRGQFGEGLKLGTLALVREGKRVTITTRDERWTAALGEHPTFPGRQVLVFDVRVRARRAAAAAAVTVSVEGLTDEEHADCLSRFRVLTDAKSSATDSCHGDLLVNQPGRIYVKGIYVETRKGLVFGYDLFAASTDRDRRMVSAWDFNYHAGAIIKESLAKGLISIEQVYGLLEKNADETKGVCYHFGVDETQGLTVCFCAVHGATAIPCANDMEVKRLEQLGRKGVICPDGLRGLIERHTGTATEAIAAASRAPLAIYHREQLTDAEMASYDWALSEVASIHPSVATLDIEVVDFPASKILGTFQAGRIRLARHILASRVRTLGALIHESARFVGDDGATIWEALAERWLG